MYASSSTSSSNITSTRETIRAATTNSCSDRHLRSTRTPTLSGGSASADFSASTTERPHEGAADYLHLTGCPPSSASHCTPRRPRPASVRSTPAQHATTPTSRPRCGRQSRPFPWCTYRARIWRCTMRCWPEVCAGDAAEHGVDDVVEAVRPDDGGRGVGAATDAGRAPRCAPVLLEVVTSGRPAR